MAFPLFRYCGKEIGKCLYAARLFPVFYLLGF